MSSVLSAAQRTETDASRLVCSDGRRPRLILAEDSPAARILTAVLLRRMGCDVDTVEHGEDALSHILSRAYDVIILDIEMPVMDGATTARKVRKLAGPAATTPIVAFSAFLADTQAHMVRDLFDGVLAKPAGRHALHAVLKKVLAARPDAAGHPPSHDAGNLAHLPADGGALDAIRSDIPHRAWRDLLATAMSELKHDLGAAFSALSRGDFEQLRRHCHVIKGVARTFAARELAELADAIENRIISHRPGDLADELNRLKACAQKTLRNLSSLASSATGTFR